MKRIHEMTESEWLDYCARLDAEYQDRVTEYEAVTWQGFCTFWGELGETAPLCG